MTESAPRENEPPAGPASGAVRFVLVGTTHPGNIGASARAMKAMGFEHLSLVAPKTFPAADATAMASGADDVLAAATVVPTLERAITDCVLVVGTTARERHLEWPLLSPAEAARRLAAAAVGGPVAVVFGARAIRSEQRGARLLPARRAHPDERRVQFAEPRASRPDLCVRAAARFHGHGRRRSGRRPARRFRRSGPRISSACTRTSCER